MAAIDLTPERLRELLDYDEETGLFTWKIQLGNRGAAGKIAGRIGKNRSYIGIGGDQFFAHRLAWFYVYGLWPKKGIDHIDGDPLNNRIANLREANQAENLQNYKKPKTNTSGFMGVRIHSTTGKWQASISCGKKREYLGIYETKELAYLAYLSAKERLHTFNPTVRA